MSKKLYVGNLSYNTTEAKLREAFATHGVVTSVNMVTDRQTGRPRGFAFVEMETEQGANAAIAALNGKEMDGRDLTVSEARPPRERGGERGYGHGGSRGRDRDRRW